MKFIYTLILLSLMTGFSLYNRVAATSVVGLLCEQVENPPGVDASRPRLSWQLTSTERGQKQTAYQILVAGSEEKLRRGAR
jgi:alpha-L-rhamnosidase